MKIRKILTVSALSLSLISLTGCGGKATSQPVQSQSGSSQTSQNNSSTGAARAQGSGSNQSSTSQSSKGSNSGSSQSGSSQQGGGTGSNSGGNNGSNTGNSNGNNAGSSAGTNSGNNSGSLSGGNSGNSNGNSGGGTSSTGSSTGQTNQGSTSSQNGESGQAGSPSSSSKPVTQHTNAPKTKHEALVYTKDTLGTRVPLMLPNDVPVAKGQYLTSTTHSETWYYKTNFYETNQPERVNSRAAAQGILIASVEGTEYKNAASARNSINGYIQAKPVKGMTLDLGHGIKALEEGAAGHSYIIWNEGHWCIRLDQPSDPIYRNKTYPNGKLLAERVVTYLNQNFLPAPQGIGVITINDWNHNAQTTIQWQYHEMTYQVTSTDPFNALAVAVAMHFTSK